MARYIDADQIDYTVTMVGMDENAGYRAVAFESDIDAMPTADVVPKSEVERLQTENLILKQKRLTLYDRLEFVKKARADVAREIFEEIERTCVDTFGNFYIGATHGAFAELKEKYTEVEK